MKKILTSIILIFLGVFLIFETTLASTQVLFVGGKITNSIGPSTALRLLLKNAPVSLGDLLTVERTGKKDIVFSGLAIGACKKGNKILGLGIIFMGFGIVTLGYCVKG